MLHRWALRIGWSNAASIQKIGCGATPCADLDEPRVPTHSVTFGALLLCLNVQSKVIVLLYYRSRSRKVLAVGPELKVQQQFSSRGLRDLHPG